MSDSADPRELEAETRTAATSNAATRSIRPRVPGLVILAHPDAGRVR